jgi:membrane protein insertase Oxa1/YidC/SpoIIIJ
MSFSDLLHKRFFLAFPRLLILNAGILNRDIRSILNVRMDKIKVELKSRFLEIQPQMQEIQNRYKNDKEKPNAEMMKLYQENKVNPAIMRDCQEVIF